MTFGERRVGVDFNPSGSTMVDTIKGKAADLIDGLETAGFNEPGEVARLKALAMTDIESAAHWAVKAATRLGGRVTRLVTTLRQFYDWVGWLRLRRWSQAIERVAEVERAAQATAPAGERMTTDEVAKPLIDGDARPQGTARRRNRQPRLWVGRDGGQARGAPITHRLAASAPHVETLHVTPAAHLDRRPPRGRAPRARFLVRLESPDPARRSAAPRTAASTRPARRQPRRPHAACLAPVEAPRPLQRAPAPLQSSRGHQTPHRPRTAASPPQASRVDPGKPDASNTLTSAHAALRGAESAPKAASAALTDTTARRALAMRPARSVHRSIGARTPTSCVPVIP